MKRIKPLRQAVTILALFALGAAAGATMPAAAPAQQGPVRGRCSVTT
jgi:hypothetical protein